jgi:hypothetical protein
VSWCASGALSGRARNRRGLSLTPWCQWRYGVRSGRTLPSRHRHRCARECRDVRPRYNHKRGMRRTRGEPDMRRALALVAAFAATALLTVGGAAAHPGQHGPTTGHLIGTGEWGKIDFVGQLTVHDLKAQPLEPAAPRSAPAGPRSASTGRSHMTAPYRPFSRLARFKNLPARVAPGTHTSW